jgi:hypothetical protein
LVRKLVWWFAFFIGWFVSYLDLTFIAVELLKGRKLLLFLPGVLIPGEYPLWPFMKAEAQYRYEYKTV